MSSPRSRARWLRGGLVGLSSAPVAVGAHAVAGGELPQGATLILAALVCASVGAVLAGMHLEGRRIRVLAVIGALVVAQALGHVVLTVAADLHAHGSVGPSMFAAHVAGAVMLGVAISAVEYLYVLCTSVMCWLRLLATGARPPVGRSTRMVPSDVVAQSVLLCSGLGIRGPPRWSASAA